VSPNKTAMLAYVALSWDPMSQNGFAWLDAARVVLDRNMNETGSKFYFTGVCSDSLDAVRYVYLFTNSLILCIFIVMVKEIFEQGEQGKNCACRSCYLT
jgi:hypothetical protein